jgi:MFS family permease
MSSPTPSKAQLRRNLLLGVANGMLGRFFRDLTDPALVLTWFASQLGASVLVIGLLQPISRGAGFLAQVLSAGSIQQLPRKMAAYRVMAVLRALCWSLLVAAVFWIANCNASLLLAVFLLIYLLFSMLRGASALTFMDIVGKAIPSDRRGTFFGWRQFSGGLLALAGSALVRYILDERSGLEFPFNFGWLFAIAGLAGMVGWLCFALVTEPDAPVRSDALPFGAQLRRMGYIVRHNGNYARFMLSMVALLTSTVALPFYTVFAKEQLGAPTGMAGVYLGVFTAGSVGSTLLWGRLSDRRGNRMVLWLVGLLSIPVPLLSLLFGVGVSYSAFALAFLLLGSSRSGLEMGYMNFVLDAAPAAERVLYVTVANTVSGVVNLLLMAGGVIAEHWGLNAVLALSCVCALLSVFLIGAVREPRRYEVRP